jgi:hypothetical protein
VTLHAAAAVLGLGLADTLGLGDALRDGLALGLTLGLGDALRDGLTLGLGDPVVPPGAVPQTRLVPS